MLATARDGDGTIALNYHAQNAYLVVGGTGTLTVTRVWRGQAILRRTPTLTKSSDHTVVSYILR